MPSLHIYTLRLGVGGHHMLWCQGVQNTGLSNHKLESVITCTVWSQTDR